MREAVPSGITRSVENELKVVTTEENPLDCLPGQDTVYGAIYIATSSSASHDVSQMKKRI